MDNSQIWGRATTLPPPLFSCKSNAKDVVGERVCLGIKRACLVFASISDGFPAVMAGHVLLCWCFD